MTTSSENSDEPLQVGNYCVSFIGLLGQRKALEGQGLLLPFGTEAERIQLNATLRQSVGEIIKLQGNGVRDDNACGMFFLRRRGGYFFASCRRSAVRCSISVVSGSGGCRKVRWARSGMGKSGGARQYPRAFAQGYQGDDSSWRIRTSSPARNWAKNC